MKSIVFFTPADARDGFALAGVRQVVTDQSRLPAVLATVAAAQDTGVVVVDERLLDGDGWNALREAQWRSTGVIVVLPAPATEVTVPEEDDYIRRLVRGAIGYQVRVHL